MKKLIKRKYTAKYYLDKLPAGYMSYNSETKEVNIEYNTGIPLGEVEDNHYIIYNHLQFHILLHEIKDKKFEIVGFNILPMSIKHDGQNPICAKNQNGNFLYENNGKQTLSSDGKFLYTYDIVFEKSNLTLSTRWDHYKSKERKNIRWIGIILSNCMMIFYSIIICYIITTNLRDDIKNYNYRVVVLEKIYDNDWKKISGDVFRAPMRNKSLLSIFVGIGVQLFLTMFIILFLFSFGILYPEKRINILKLGIFIFCLMGVPGGYISATIYKFFGGAHWQKNAILTATLFPGILFFGYTIINIILKMKNIEVGLNLSDIIYLFCLWIFFTFPLILIGHFLGVKLTKINIKNKINTVPSVIPVKPWYLHYRFLVFITGFVGFLTIFIELNYVMTSIWKDQLYFMPIFLCISFNLYIIVTGEISIFVVFLNLCYGDYNWWWKSFIVGSSPVIYFFAFSIYYFLYWKIFNFGGIVVYFSLMMLISTMMFFISGSISLLMTFIFVKIIYSKIKID